MVNKTGFYISVWCSLTVRVAYKYKTAIFQMKIQGLRLIIQQYGKEKKFKTSEFELFLCFDCGCHFYNHHHSFS